MQCKVSMNTLWLKLNKKELLSVAEKICIIFPDMTDAKIASQLSGKI